jgi:hypothetical protein
VCEDVRSLTFQNWIVVYEACLYISAGSCSAVSGSCAFVVLISSRPGQHLTKIGIGKLYGMSKIPGIQCMSVA